MQPEQQVVFKILSFLLSYPEGEEFWQGFCEVPAALHEFSDTPIKRWLLQTVTDWISGSRSDLRREYIQTFDFRESTCLYLTAHEFGDSRERGMALIEMHQWLRSGGYDVAPDELPDYLPAVFEFLSVKPIEMDAGTLECRLAHVCHRILEHLGENSSYNQLFCAAIASLPTVQYEGEGIAFPKRQLADTDDLPYPLNFS